MSATDNIVDESSRVIPLTTTKTSDDLPEYTILELQGELQVEGGETTGLGSKNLFVHHLCDKKLGLLEFTESRNPKLNLGNVTVTGKVHKYSPPLTLFRQENGELKRIALIRKRILFSERPKPILKSVLQDKKRGGKPKFKGKGMLFRKKKKDT